MGLAEENSVAHTGQIGLKAQIHPVKQVAVAGIRRFRRRSPSAGPAQEPARHRVCWAARLTTRWEDTANFSRDHLLYPFWHSTRPLDSDLVFKIQFRGLGRSKWAIGPMVL